MKKNESLIRGRPAPSMMELSTFVIFKAGQCIEQKFTQHFEGLGIKARHFAVLRVLVNDEASTQQELCESLWIDRATMTGIMKDLVREELVVREEHADDKRCFMLSVSAAGRRFYQKHAREFERLEAEIFPSLSRADLKRVQEILNRALLDQVDKPPTE